MKGDNDLLRVSLPEIELNVTDGSVLQDGSSIKCEDMIHFQQWKHIFLTEFRQYPSIRTRLCHILARYTQLFASI